MAQSDEKGQAEKAKDEKGRDEKAQDEKGRDEASPAYRRIGHKGADAIAPGNTIDSFVAAVDHGVDMIELDVLRDREGRLVIAHDHQDALSRRPLGLIDALDAFLDPPLDEVEIDCDLKLPGREAELAGALAGHGLLERSMVSTMEVDSLRKLRKLEPDLRLGWTYPKTRRDWTQYRLLAPALAAGIAVLRRRFPVELERRAGELNINAVWAYHRIITPKLVEVAKRTDVELIAWTVDEAERMRDLIDMGVDGICTNDPRLFAAVEAPVAATEEAEAEKLSRSEKRAAKKFAKDEEKARKQDEKAAKGADKDPKKAAKAPSG
jgi:glycerophosphoryl diester phosphodiesterase